MKPPSGGKPRELPKKGDQHAAIVSLIDLGTQPGSKMYPEEKRQILVGYECVNETTSDDKAMVVFKKYTFSNSERSKLTQEVVDELLPDRDSDWDMKDLLGLPCVIKIVLDDKGDVTYANVDKVYAPQKGVKIRKHSEPLTALFLTPDEFDQEVFDSLGEKLRNKIAASKEYAACAGPGKRRAFTPANRKEEKAGKRERNGRPAKKEKAKRGR
jgi:hypothetical protein